MARSAALVAMLLLCLAGVGGSLAGCGNSRTPAPSLVHPAPPGGFRMLGYPAAGVTIAAPADWTVIRERPPMIGVITSATAVIALWRYPRHQPVPTNPAMLTQARLALIAAVRATQPAVDVIGSRLLRVDGHPAVELDALERLHGLLRRVRSTHVFARRSEIVLEEYAPPDVFRAVDPSVFSAVRRSLVISAS